jgi:hypothetical protein
MAGKVPMPGDCATYLAVRQLECQSEVESSTNRPTDAIEPAVSSVTARPALSNAPPRPSRAPLTGCATAVV